MCLLDNNNKFFQLPWRKPKIRNKWTRGQNMSKNVPPLPTQAAMCLCIPLIYGELRGLPNNPTWWLQLISGTPHEKLGTLARRWTYVGLSLYHSAFHSINLPCCLRLHNPAPLSDWRRHTPSLLIFYKTSFGFIVMATGAIVATFIMLWREVMRCVYEICEVVAVPTITMNFMFKLCIMSMFFGEQLIKTSRLCSYWWIFR